MRETESIGCPGERNTSCTIGGAPPTGFAIATAPPQINRKCTACEAVAADFGCSVPFSPSDTRTASGQAFLDMLGVFAEFETNLRRERQLEGISAAKARGAYKGRKRSIDETGVRRLRSQGLGPTEIARQLGIGRASVYRALARADG